MAERFAETSEEEILLIEGKAKNANTTRTTQTWLKVFKEWATARFVIPELSLYTPEDLNEILRRFYSEVRKQNDKEYEPDSLRVMQAALQRHLSSCKYPKNILKDTEFNTSNDVIEGKARELDRGG